MFSIDKKVNYRNFGFMPKGRFLRDLYGKLFGHRNLMKRLQAKDIMKAMDIHPTDVVLDFGCGAVGYFSVEFAKQAQKVYGIDIVEGVDKIKVPPSLKEKLEFIRVRGEDIPFDDNTFDIIFASEVIATVPDPHAFLKQWKRVLKPGGRLVLSNGSGRPNIKAAYENGHPRLESLKQEFGNKVPATYDDYVAILNREFGNAQNAFFQLEDIEGLLKQHEFSRLSVSHTPSLKVANHFYWKQFEYYVKKGKVFTRENFLPQYWYFAWVNAKDKNKNPGGILYVAQNNK